jgi:3-hydroxy acid dehydrogenase / malonic semialdehyde reductase
MEKIALITGATSGIGMATARKAAQLNYHVIITGRRSDRLVALQGDLEKTGIQVKPMCFDVQNREASIQAWNDLPEAWKRVDVLVNNAGLAAGYDPIDKGSWADWEQMIDTNIKGLLTMSQLVIPGMIERKKGHIINLSSIAGMEVYANGNVYCATKHAVSALTKAMRIDLLPHQIKVSSIAPGMVETEFSVVRYHGDQEKADKVYKGLTPLYAEDVADAIEFMITRPAHVNVNEMLLMPTRQASGVYNYRDDS